MNELRNDPTRDVCREAIREAVQRWIVKETKGFVPTYDLRKEEIPTPRRLSDLIPSWLNEGGETPDQIKSFVLRIPSCSTQKGQAEFALSVPREELSQFESSLKKWRFTPPSSFQEVVNELESLLKRKQQFDSLVEQVALEKLQSEVGVVKESPPPASSSAKDDLFIKLLQTSITRFGLLAVVGFFVSILVSLYRYNVRLAAFYMARADVLRLYAPNIASSDFALLATVLSPTVEFGKAPQPPLGQLIEMAKTVKEAGK
jgi:hypothetical protein